jgi:hypothetical protein
MMAAPTPDPRPETTPQVPIYKATEVRAKLDEWRGHLEEAQHSKGPYTVPGCWEQLDRWLDELLEVRGR